MLGKNICLLQKKRRRVNVKEVFNQEAKMAFSVHLINNEKILYIFGVRGYFY